MINTRKSITLSLFICATMFLSPAVSLARAPRTRNFEFTYIVKVKNVPKGASNLKLWAPYPPSDQAQTILNVRVESPYPVSVNYDTQWGNRILFMSVNNPKPEGFTLKVTYKVQRREVLTEGMDLTKNLSIRDRGQFARWLTPGVKAIINNTVRKFTAQAIKGKKTDMAKARGIYDFILGHMDYNKQIPGWGQGDVARACVMIDGTGEGAGNCTDFHSLFSSMMRVAGIPVEFEMGYPLKPGADQAPKPGSYHCWAKFFMSGYGWIPVDISQARKASVKGDTAKANYYWGALDQNRIRLSSGRDILLTPPQAGARLNYFGGARVHIEVDGKPFNSYERLVGYRNLQ